LNRRTVKGGMESDWEEMMRSNPASVEGFGWSRDTVISDRYEASDEE
jgi:hypothetical protein